MGPTFLTDLPQVKPCSLPKYYSNPLPSPICYSPSCFLTDLLPCCCLPPPQSAMCHKKAASATCGMCAAVWPPLFWGLVPPGLRRSLTNGNKVNIYSVIWVDPQPLVFFLRIILYWKVLSTIPITHITSIPVSKVNTLMLVQEWLIIIIIYPFLRGD